MLQTEIYQLETMVKGMMVDSQLSMSSKTEHSAKVLQRQHQLQMIWQITNFPHNVVVIKIEMLHFYLLDLRLLMSNTENSINQYLIQITVIRFLTTRYLACFVIHWGGCSLSTSKLSTLLGWRHSPMYIGLQHYLCLSKSIGAGRV